MLWICSRIARKKKPAQLSILKRIKCPIWSETLELLGWKLPPHVTPMSE